MLKTYVIYLLLSSFISFLLLPKVDYLILNIRLFKSIAVLLVDHFKIKGEEEGGNAEASEDNQWSSVVVGDELGACLLGCYNGGVVGIG